MKQITNFRLFNKIVRKYYKKHCIKRVDHFTGKRFISYWEENDWIGYRISNSVQLTPKVCEAIRSMVGDVIYNETIKTLGEFIDVKPNVWFKDDEMGMHFKGVMITNRDAYLIIAEAHTSKDEYLYPMYKLIDCKNNLYPNS